MGSKIPHIPKQLGFFIAQVTLALGVIPNVMLPGSMRKGGGGKYSKQWSDILKKLPQKWYPLLH